jgi:hypothetical protein
VSISFPKRLKINLFTPCRVLGSKLILAAPNSPAKLGSVLRSPPAGGAGVNEENQYISVKDI